MKNIVLSILALGICMTTVAQEFDKSLTGARTAYNAGNLEDARFNLENALREVDIAIGKEIMKLLPTSLGVLTHNASQDNVTGMSSSFAGLFVHREYGKEGGNRANIDVISDSPIMAGVNALLAMPAVMNSANSGQKVIKIQGYKSLLTRQEDENGGTSGYELQTPFGNSMLTFHFEGPITEAEMTKLANTIPLEKIIKVAQ
jgi:hypothetical protein